MLERLFGSRTRVKLMKLFLLHPEEKYSLNQIVKLLKLQVLPIKKELENLEKFGMVITGLREEAEGEGSEIKSEKKFYQVNSNFVLYEELKALLIKAQLLYEQDFIDKLMKLGKVKMLILTGIFVSNANSVIDLLIVGSINKSRLLRVLRELEQELGKEINFTHMETNEFIYRRNMTDVFVYEILEGKKIVILDELGT